MTDASTLHRDLSLASDLARAAGREILRIKAEAIASSQLKADDSPVTQADLASDAIIRAGLAPLGDAVVTEETWKDGDVGKHRRAWFIDPIDGTEDFVQGRRDYVVQIGLCIDGEPTLGVLFQPETGILWRGVVPEGLCERVDADGTVRARTVRDRALAAPRVAISVSHPSAVVDFIVNELKGVPLARGSVGLKVGAILDDEADAYVSASRRIKVWDTCAPAAVLLAGGGVVTSLGGAPLKYTGLAPHDDGVCMWTPAARTRLLPQVQDAVKRFRNTGAPG